MEWIEYHKILRHGKKNTHKTLESDYNIIAIQEKLDGGNASFFIDEYSNVHCFSRNIELNEKETLRGFYNWVQEKIVPQKHKLLTGCIYYGEWLVPHKINYKEEYLNDFYLFDIYFKDINTFFTNVAVENEADNLGIKPAPILYCGEYISLEHIQSFVGKSEMSIDGVGEGVVVKNYSYRNREGNQSFTKFVSDNFAEMANIKKHDPSSNVDFLGNFITRFTTKARIEKILLKLVDEGILEEEYGIENMGIILKHLNTRIYEDIVEEELDVLLKEVRKKISKKVPLLVKEVLVEAGRA